MAATDEDALVCDFAEYYHIYNWRGLSARYAAVLACGLRADSRIKMSLSGQKHTAEEIMLAATVDALSLLVWMRSKDGANNRNRPASLVQILTGNEKKGDEIMTFESGAAFEARRMALLGVM